jgi:putative transposase
MPRIARGLSDGFVYHALNRGNGRQCVFHKDGDYKSFVDLLAEAQEVHAVKVLAFCLMPNHFHLLVQPRKADDLSKWMQWLMTSHVRRYHCHYRTSGHVWQGRYKSFIVQEDEHLLTVMRYVEGNPVRAKLVESAGHWPWSSHHKRMSGRQEIISDPPIPLPNNWTEFVDTELTSIEIEKMRRSVNRQTPYGKDVWMQKICDALGLHSTLRDRGRPRNEREK